MTRALIVVLFVVIVLPTALVGIVHYEAPWRTIPIIVLETAVLIVLGIRARPAGTQKVVAEVEAEAGSKATPERLSPLEPLPIDPRSLEANCAADFPMANLPDNPNEEETLIYGEHHEQFMIKVDFEVPGYFTMRTPCLVYAKRNKARQLHLHISFHAPDTSQRDSRKLYRFKRRFEKARHAILGNPITRITHSN